MIYIRENITSKVPGITSLFVKFDYNEDVVAAMKTLPCSNYSKKNKEWEVPVIYLSHLIEALCMYDDIELTLCNVIIEDDEEFKLKEYKTKPFKYQEEGIQFGLNHLPIKKVLKFGLLSNQFHGLYMCTLFLCKYHTLSFQEFSYHLK